jgi:thiamine biosynthesis lipoprotein
MGYPVSFDVRDTDPALGEAVDWAAGWLRDVDQRFSPSLANSEVSRLDRGELAAEEISDDLAHVLEVCAEYEDRSGGAFRTRLPGHRFEPCAVVKGWAVQRAADMLEFAGARNFCLNAGGDAVVRGEPRPGAAWQVGIRHPDLGDKLCAVLVLRHGAVATSAADECIVDGRTGLPARELLSITVVADDLGVADTTSVAAFAMGSAGVQWAAAEPGCEVFAVDADRRVFRSTGLS